MLPASAAAAPPLGSRRCALSATMTRLPPRKLPIAQTELRSDDGQILAIGGRRLGRDLGTRGSVAGSEQFMRSPPPPAFSSFASPLGEMGSTVNGVWLQFTQCY